MTGAEEKNLDENHSEDEILLDQGDPRETAGLAGCDFPVYRIMYKERRSNQPIIYICILKITT